MIPGHKLDRIDRKNNNKISASNNIKTTKFLRHSGIILCSKFSKLIFSTRALIEDNTVNIKKRMDYRCNLYEYSECLSPLPEGNVSRMPAALLRFILMLKD